MAGSDGKRKGGRLPPGVITPAGVVPADQVHHGFGPVKSSSTLRVVDTAY